MLSFSIGAVLPIKKTVSYLCAHLDHLRVSGPAHIRIFLYTEGLNRPHAGVNRFSNCLYLMSFSSASHARHEYSFHARFVLFVPFHSRM
jgi:hypothetical protein